MTMGEAASQAPRILVIAPARLGDAVFLGPGVRALRSRYPRSTIGVLSTPRGAEVARHLPGCDEVLLYDKTRADRGLAGFRRVVETTSHSDKRPRILMRLDLD